MADFNYASSIKFLKPNYFTSCQTGPTLPNRLIGLQFTSNFANSGALQLLGRDSMVTPMFKRTLETLLHLMPGWIGCRQACSRLYLLHQLCCNSEWVLYFSWLLSISASSLEFTGPGWTALEIAINDLLFLEKSRHQTVGSSHLIAALCLIIESKTTYYSVITDFLR